MKKFIFLLLMPLMLQAQFKLSETAEIHIVTCGPYQGELYSAFGHSAIRVKDEVRGFDLLYNYGVFDFNQPHFYLNFTRGHLNYELAVMDYRSFRDVYISENRYIHEQVLNLRPDEKQQLFNFLQWNSRPENKNYFYDYFYDNCATRVRDAVKNTFGDRVIFDGSHITTEYTVRDLTDMYLQQQRWGDLGIDLCLGLPMDTLATPWMYMYLPDYLEQGFNNAYLIRNGDSVPLVKETIITYEARPEEVKKDIFSPTVAFSLLFLLGVVITVLGWRKNRSYFWFDGILMSVVGLVGWLLIFLWFFTDHRAAANNLNVLWAFPLYFPLVFMMRRVRWFFLIMGILHILTLIFWNWLPQDLHNSLIPLVMLLALRCFANYFASSGSRQEFRGKF